MVFTREIKSHQTALGLEYLRAEGIVHGDLHAGNILVDETGAVRLTDFGLSLLSGGTAYNYGSQHGGGAMHYTALELFDPEAFGLESTRPTFHSDIYAFACVCIEVCFICLYAAFISSRGNSFTPGNLRFMTLPATRFLRELYGVTDPLNLLFRMVTLCLMLCGYWCSLAGTTR